MLVWSPNQNLSEAKCKSLQLLLFIPYFPHFKNAKLPLLVERLYLWPFHYELKLIWKKKSLQSNPQMIFVLHFASAQCQIHRGRESKRNVANIIWWYEFFKILICRPTQSAFFFAVGAVEDNRNNWEEQNEKCWGVRGGSGKYLVISSTFFSTKINPHLEPMEALNARTIAVPCNSTWGQLTALCVCLGTSLSAAARWQN